MAKELDETEAVRLYTEERFTLRMVAEKLNVDHHRISRVLKKHGVSITRKNRLRVFTLLTGRKPRDLSLGGMPYTSHHNLYIT